MAEAKHVTHGSSYARRVIRSLLNLFFYNFNLVGMLGWFVVA